ncbi:MAG TPA: cyclic dehypoxanthinyl futalosine synthase [Planctomycetota bacterium]|nr:cyclic dehypoxanthinyl futalosine synthase [Planctomycetota bacterium]
MPSSVRDIVEKSKAGGRLTDAEGLALFEQASLPELGEGAHAVRTRLHPDDVCTYIVDRNINYTNTCITYCKFCAFYRPPGHPEEYTLSKEAMAQKIKETKALGGVQILLQGGHHPYLKLDWYEDMLRHMKSFDIHVHGFSPSEIQHFATLNRLSVRDVLVKLRAAGLDSIPGGGGEILVDRVREEISPLKIKTDAWLEVMEEAHKIGMKTTATMMYGHVETYAERVEHLRRLREQQDRSLARKNGGGYTAFICWSLQPDNTEMAGSKKTGGYEYLKTLAVSRMYLDNFPNLQSSWVTQGEKVGQMALLYGANDMGSTMLEENVVSQAGANFRMNEASIRRVIEDLGYRARRRNMYYELLETNHE